MHNAETKLHLRQVDNKNEKHLTHIESTCRYHSSEQSEFSLFVRMNYYETTNEIRFSTKQLR